MQGVVGKYAMSSVSRVLNTDNGKYSQRNFFTNGWGMGMEGEDTAGDYSSKADEIGDSGTGDNYSEGE